MKQPQRRWQKHWLLPPMPGQNKNMRRQQHFRIICMNASCCSTRRHVRTYEWYIFTKNVDRRQCTANEENKTNQHTYTQARKKKRSTTNQKSQPKMRLQRAALVNDSLHYCNLTHQRVDINTTTQRHNHISDEVHKRTHAHQPTWQHRQMCPRAKRHK